MRKEADVMKVLVADNISEAGIECLRREKGITTDVKLGLSEDELVEAIAEYDALVVRSAVKVTKRIIDAGINLKVIGRAGVGVDNIDTEYATRKGVIVMNSPFGNTISAAEHTMAMMLALARHIPQADRKLKAGQWDRKSFIGTELNGKTLGVVGIGKVGKEVAVRAGSFNMKIIAYDPYISKEAADELGVVLKELNDVLAESDFITVHTPLTPATKGLIGKKEFRIMKRGVRLVNCARGGIIDEQALLDAIKKGTVRGAALDVFEEEPPLESELVRIDSVITTPHLGASTAEAQENVSTDVARQIVEYKKTGRVINAINMLQIHPDALAKTAPYLKLAEQMGIIVAHIHGGGIRGVEIAYTGEIAALDTRHLTLSALKGLLFPICGSGVNYVNAPYLAKERKIEVRESKTETPKNYTNQINVAAAGARNERNEVCGVVVNGAGRVTRVNDFEVELVPEGNILMVYHDDAAGAVGAVATLLAENGINIASMSVGRNVPHQSALMALNVDQDVPEAVVEEMSRIKNVNNAVFIKI